MLDLNRIFYVHTEAMGACFTLAAAMLEFICGALIGWDDLFAIIFGFGGGVFFLIVTLLQVWSIVRFEQRYN